MSAPDYDYGYYFEDAAVAVDYFFRLLLEVVWALLDGAVDSNDVLGSADEGGPWWELPKDDVCCYAAWEEDDCRSYYEV